MTMLSVLKVNLLKDHAVRAAYEAANHEYAAIEVTIRAGASDKVVKRDPKPSRRPRTVT